MKYATLALLCLFVSVVCQVDAAAGPRVLPDEVTLNVGAVQNVGKSVSAVLTKRSMRADNCRVVLWTDDGFKDIDIPVTTYSGYVKNDPLIHVNGNIEPGGILNLNFTENRMFIGRIRGLKIAVPEGPSSPDGSAVASKCTPTMSSSIKVVPLNSLPRRQVPSPGGYLVPEVPMRRTRWLVQVYSSYTSHSSVEKAVSEVEQRMNDGDFVYARDVGTAWEIDTLVVHNPKATKGLDLNTLYPDNPARLENCKWAGFTGVPGKNQGKFILNVSGIHHEAAILLHESAHVYGNPWHQLDVNDGLCGGGAYWAYNNVAILLEAQKSLNETNFPGVIYNGPLPPCAMYDFANTRKDTPVTIDVLENDYDGNGDALTLQAVQSTSDQGGTVVVSKDGKAVYTPPPGFVGADKFTYTVVDGTGMGNRSGEVKVDVRTDGLAIHFDFEEVEVERLEDRRKTLPIDAALWFYDAYDRRPAEEKLLYHFRNLGPYNTGNGAVDWIRPDVVKSLRGKGAREPNPAPYETGRGTTHWITKYAPVGGVRGKGIWQPGGHRWAHVKLGDGGDPGRASLSASVWVLYPPGGGGDTIICKGGEPFGFVNGWSISGGGRGGKFTFSGNVARMLEREAFSLTSEEPIEENKWYHLVMIMDREKKELRAWVNNKEVKNPDAKTGIPDGVIEYYGPLHLFNRYTGKWWGAAVAVVDEVKIFTSVLTPEQVAELYAEGKDAKVPDFPKLDK